jgi:hypothetical protein
MPFFLMNLNKNKIMFLEKDSILTTEIYTETMNSTIFFLKMDF